ncbi:Arv1 protein [Penicillium sp. IBT 18751x]|nr:Arv1 protein [Penicillium sp. IBT 18751x]
MPICIECSYPVSHLYSAYSRADDRSQGKGVRLTQCPRCQRFADKYVEYDFVVIFIDLVLIKPQVYRHLLFNRLGRDDNRFDRSIIRLGILLLLFDVYLTWARLEKDPSLATTFVARAPIVVQYLFFLTLNAAATFAHHLTVRLLASILVPKSHRYVAAEASSTNTTSTGDTTPLPSGPPTPTIRASPPSQPNTPSQQQLSLGAAALPSKTTPHTPFHDHTSALDPSLLPPSAIPAPQRPPPLRRASTAPPQNIRPLPPPTAASPTAISTALLVSSCAKLFPILLVIWGADGSGNGNLSDIQAGNTDARKDMGASKAALSSNRDSASPSFLESFLAAAESSLRPYLPTRYVTGLFGVLASLLSLGVVDTHLVLLSNIEALYILLGCGYLRAVAVAVAGQIARWAVQRVILGAVGVG